MRRPASKAQAGMYGARAGGQKTKAGKLTRTAARYKLRGAKLKKLPAHSRRKR